MKKKIYKSHSRNIFYKIYTKIILLSLKQLSWGFLILLFVVFTGGEFWQAWYHSVWQKDRQLYLAIDDSSHMGIMRVDPQFAEIKTITIPSQTELDVAYGYGKYRADKLEFLAQQEHRKYGDLLQHSLTQTLGIITDGYIVSKHPTDDLSKLFLFAFFKQAKTNLTDWDLIKLFFFSSSLKYGQKNAIELDKTLALIKANLPDDSEIYSLKKQELSRLMLTEMANPDLLNFAGTLEIYNGTQHIGWAQQIQQILSNSGFDVVGVRQADQAYQKTQLLSTRDLYDEYAIKVLINYFGIKQQTSTQPQRADMVLILGEDLWKKYFTR